MAEYLPFVSVDTWTIIMSWVNLLVLFLLLKHFLFKRVNKVLNERAGEIENTYETAENTKTEAEKLRSEYEARLQNAGHEANVIINSAVEQANLRSDGIIGEANEKVRNIMEKSRKQIEQSKEQSLKEARADIASIAADIAEKLIGKKFNTDDDEKLIEEIINKI